MKQEPQDPRRVTDTTEINSVSGVTPEDLKAAAEEARRLFREKAQDDSAPREGEDGNTTTDLAAEAKKALNLLAQQTRGGAALEALGQARFTRQMLLDLEMVESGERMSFAVDQELVVGRGDNLSDYQPDVDLTPFGAYRLGLSRRHAILRRENETLIIVDLNSRNGTHINGQTLKGGEMRPLRDGDEIRFGNLALRVIFRLA